LATITGPDRRGIPLPNAAKLAPANHLVLNTRAQPDGKIRVISSSLDGEKIIFPGQVGTLRWDKGSVVFVVGLEAGA
jgi:hypothetical protein